MAQPGPVPRSAVFDHAAARAQRERADFAGVIVVEGVDDERRRPPLPAEQRFAAAPDARAGAARSAAAGRRAPRRNAVRGATFHPRPGRRQLQRPRVLPVSPARAAPYRVVIVGGGAGGLPLAAELARRHRRRGDVAVTLVDALATHVWKPLLHEVAAGRMDADAHEVDYPALAYRHGFRFRQGAMLGARPGAAPACGSMRWRTRRAPRSCPSASSPTTCWSWRSAASRNDFGVAGRGGARDSDRHAARGRAVPSPSARCERARERPQGRRRRGRTSTS